MAVSGRVTGKPPIEIQSEERNHIYDLPPTGPLERKLMFECADHDVVQDYFFFRIPRAEIYRL